MSSVFSDIASCFLQKDTTKHQEITHKLSRGMIFDHLDSLSGLEGPWRVLGRALGGFVGGPWGVPWSPRGALGVHVGPFFVAK